jgi:hypothetical protein
VRLVKKLLSCPVETCLGIISPDLQTHGGRLNQTLGGDFLNGRVTNQVETSPLPIVAGQGGLVIANQPGGLGLSTANLFAPEIITNFTQIYL